MFSLPNNIWERNSRRAISVLSHSLSQDVVFDRNLHLSWLCTIDYCSVGEAICVRAIIRSRERERKWKWAHTDQPQRWFAYSWDRRTLNVLSLWCRFRELADPPFSLPQSLSARREINFDAVGADVSSLSFSVASCFIICAWFSVSQDFVPSPLVLQTPNWRDRARNSGSWSQNPQKMKERDSLWPLGNTIQERVMKNKIGIFSPKFLCYIFLRGYVLASVLDSRFRVYRELPQF